MTNIKKAKEQPLEFKGKIREKTSIQSYFADEVISEVIHDLQTECGYTEAVATKMLYTGGLKIYCTNRPGNSADNGKKYTKTTPLSPRLPLRNSATVQYDCHGPENRLY